MAGIVRDRPFSGGFRVLDPPPYRRAGDLSPPAPRTIKRRPIATLLGLPRRISVDHGQSVADGRRRAGERLCAWHLDANLSAHGAPFIGAEYRWLPSGAD